MLQFRNGPRPPNYLGRREQTRLFVLVVLLMGAVWIALEARNPQYYRWIWTWGQAGEADETVDTRLGPSVSRPDDTFVIPAPGERRHETSETVSSPLNEADLASVRDGEPFRAGERGAWFKLFDRLRQTDSADLSRQSSGPVNFIQLYRQPAEYRGKLITLSGTLRRSEPIDAPPNDLGIDSYYMTWLFPRDNPSNPIVVYTLTVPAGFPQGMTIEEQVELDGFFFKRWPYLAQDTGRSAPVVLAKSLRWTAARPAQPAPPPSTASLVGLAALVAGVVVVVVWWQTRPKHAQQPVPNLFERQSAGESGHLRILTDPNKEANPQ